MEIAQVVPEGRQIVQSYWSGGFTVSGVRHHGGLVITSTHTQALEAGGGDVSSEQLVALRPLAEAGDVELLVIGTGSAFRLCPAALRSELRGWGLAVEAMATPAACRTYNLLITEGRRVAAALLPID